MKRNVGNLDRVLRVLVAFPAAWFAIRTRGLASFLLFGFAAVGLVSGLSGRALPYALFGIDTRSRRDRR